MSVPRVLTVRLYSSSTSVKRSSVEWVDGLLFRLVVRFLWVDFIRFFNFDSKRAARTCWSTRSNQKPLPSLALVGVVVVYTDVRAIDPSSSSHWLIQWKRKSSEDNENSLASFSGKVDMAEKRAKCVRTSSDLRVRWMPMKCLVFLLRSLFISLLYNIYIQRRVQLLADWQNVKAVARLQTYRQARGKYVHVLLVVVDLVSLSVGFVEYRGCLSRGILALPNTHAWR